VILSESTAFNSTCLAFTVTVPTRAATTRTVHRVGQAREDSSDGNGSDLFDYFDPLLSPHEYPNGISPNAKPASIEDGKDPPAREVAPLEEEEDEEARRYDPLRLDNPTNFLRANGQQSQKMAAKGGIDVDEVFDPLLSPHAYANGTPATVLGDEEAARLSSAATSAAEVPGQSGGSRSSSGTTKGGVTVGILLMDHGSRNARANERLHEMARMYERSALVGAATATTSPGGSANRVIVRAAHMEIATPSIRDGIRSLLEDGADEIVCHPYFLSPAGRHVDEDIPRIVREAIDELDIDPDRIPVRTTPAVGSSTDVMIEAIHSLVRDTSKLLDS